MADRNWMNGVRVDEWVRGLEPREMREVKRLMEDRLAMSEITAVREETEAARLRAPGENWSASPPQSGLGSGRAMSEAELLTHLFTYHNDPAKVPTYDAINRATRICAEAILHAVPACADRTHALRLIRDVRMWANAAVACDGVSF